MPKAARKNSTTKKTRVSPDPIRKLIADADKCLFEFTEAAKVESQLAAKVGKGDTVAAAVSPPPEFRYEMPTLMANEDFLKKHCRGLGKRLTQRIRHYQRALRNNPKSPIALETTEHLNADKKLLAMLPSTERKMLATLRKERVRINKIWRATGYGKARARLHTALDQFGIAKFMVNNAEPTTLDDAVAVVRWAAVPGARETGLIPWSYWDFQQTSRLLGQAHKILIQKTVSLDNPQGDGELRQASNDLVEIDAAIERLHKKYGDDADSRGDYHELEARRDDAIGTLSSVPASLMIGIKAKASALQLDELVIDFESHQEIAVSLADDLIALG